MLRGQLLILMERMLAYLGKILSLIWYTVTDLGKYLAVLRKTFIKGKNKHPKFLYIIEPVNKIFYFKR